MKKISILCFILVIIIVFSSCSKNVQIMNYNSNDYVDLYDYDNIVIPSNYLNITQDDTEQIVLIELSSNDAYVPVAKRNIVKDEDIILLEIEQEKFYYFVGTNSLSADFDKKVIGSKIGDFISSNNELGDFTAKVVGIYRNATIKDENFILNYYGYSNKNDLYDFLKDRAKNEVYYNYVVQKIEENSTIKNIPKELQVESEYDIKNLKQELKASGVLFDDYLKNNNISENELYDGFLSFYKKCMIYKAILENENITISNQEIKEKLKESDANKYEIYIDIAEQKLRNVFVVD